MRDQIKLIDTLNRPVLQNDDAANEIRLLQLDLIDVVVNGCLDPIYQAQADNITEEPQHSKIIK